MFCYFRLMLIAPFLLDVPECSNGQAHGSKKCSELPGSYKCSCNIGYSMHVKEYTCTSKPYMHDYAYKKSIFSDVYILLCVPVTLFSLLVKQGLVVYIEC